MKLEIQVWESINKSMSEVFLVIMNTFDIKIINGKKKKIFFSSLNFRSKERLLRVLGVCFQLSPLARLLFF